VNSTVKTMGTRLSEARARREQDEWLTAEEICEELKISRRTFDRWRALGIGPRSERLGGHGPLRTRRSWLEEWTVNGPESVPAPVSPDARQRRAAR
jgi:predicted DNA-binding transcriptional regulator AlpA